MPNSDAVSFLIFDVEAVADGALVSRIRYPNDNLPPADAIQRYGAELLEQTGRDVLPPSYMLPVAVAVAKIGADLNLIDIVALDEPQYRPHVMTRLFWQGWKHYGRPVLVTFNGRGYDLPVLELAAYRYGYAIPEWFNIYGRSYEQSRNRYNLEAHLDLLDFFTNFGAMRLSGGLNLLANLIGKPGKTGVDGSQVQGMHDAGKDGEINCYCRCDVLDTYFVFLRSRVLIGQISLEREQELVGEARTWLEACRDQNKAYAHDLEHWGDWQPPDSEQKSAFSSQ